MRILVLATAAAAMGASPDAASLRGSVAVADSIAEPFSDIGALLPIDDNRAMVVDRLEAALYIVDFRSGIRRQLGRTGDGPGEYRLPWSVFRGVGDTIIVYDRSNRRFSLLNADGRFLAARTLDAFIGPVVGQLGPFLGSYGPRYIDQSGRLYFSGNSFQIAPGVINQFADSSPVLRITRGAVRADTVAWLRRPNATQSGQAGSSSASVVSRYAMLYIDDWAAMGDGTLAILRSPEGVVELRTPRGQLSRLPSSIPSTRVTDWHRKRWADSAASSFSVTYPVQDGRLGAPRIIRNRGATEPPAGFPETVPPFVVGLSVSDASRLLIARVPSPAIAGVQYDVLRGDGSWSTPITLRSGRIVGVSPTRLYVVTPDSDGLQTLSTLPR